MRLSLPLLLFLAVVPLTAQADETEPGFRFHGSRLPRCTGFMIWETSFFQTPLDRLRSDRPRDALYFSWEYGAMANTSPRSAWGATAYFSNNGRGTRVALLPRYRRWLRGRLHGDISAGPYLLDSHADVPARLHGGVARTSLGISDLLSLSSQFDAVRDENGRWRVRPYVGVRVGSYAAIPMTFFNFIYAAVVGEGSMRISGSPAL